MCPARAFYETTLVDGCHTVSRSGCRITDDAGEVDAQGIARSDQVCFTLDNGPSRLRLACPFCADIVAKVENRTTQKISRKLIFGLLCGCVAL
jgi:hypothetical protein